MMETVDGVLEASGLLIAIMVVAVTLYAGRLINERFFDGRLSTFIVAMLIALMIAGTTSFVGGGGKGLAGVPLFSGLAFLGGSMLRDWTIVATANGAKTEDLKQGGAVALFALLFGEFLSFFMGVAVAFLFGFRDPIDLTTIGAGAVTFVVGPVTGEGLGASSEVIAISVAAGVTKSIVAMVLIPIIGRVPNWHTPKQAMVLGGLIGSTSGVAGGLAGLDPKLVPYGAVTATFYTGLGCLLCPSMGYLILNALF